MVSAYCLPLYGESYAKNIASTVLKPTALACTGCHNMNMVETACRGNDEDIDMAKAILNYGNVDGRAGKVAELFWNYVYIMKQ